MLIVADDIDRTERELAAGELACPDCQGELRPWGHARRRWLRSRQGRREIRPDAAAAAADRLFGPARSRWEVASALCSGRLLANTSGPYPAVW